MPGDETADGSFDKFADVLSISTAHLERYMSVARQVTRRATALPPSHPAIDTFEIPLHVTQEDRQSEDLPLGSRGGIAVRHHFPVDGEYRFKVRLQRNYQDYLKGMGWEQLLDVRLDGTLLKRFAVGGKAQGRPAGASYAGDGEPGYAGAPEWERYMQLDGDAGLEVSVQVPAGSRVVGVSFVRAVVGTGRAAAATAARPRDHERRSVHGLRERRRRFRSGDLIDSQSRSRARGRLARNAIRMPAGASVRRARHARRRFSRASRGLRIDAR